jgi:hypothetical protein
LVGSFEEVKMQANQVRNKMRVKIREKTKTLPAGETLEAGTPLQIEGRSTQDPSYFSARAADDSCYLVNASQIDPI